ncbi:hypothetical protein LCGC14_2916840, partial [marine sediment metagenome]
PSPLATFFLELLRDNTWVRQVFREIGLKSATLKIPKMTSGNTMFHWGEGASGLTEGGADGSSSSITKTAWSSVTLSVDKVGVLTGYTTELAEDSVINVAEMVISAGASAMAEGEEQAFLMGSTVTGTNEIGTNYTAGQPEKLYEGLIQAVPYNSSSGVVPVSAAGWTAQNTATDNVIDAAQALLTFDHLNELMSIVEDAKGNGALTDFAMSAKPIARMRNPVEFEMFQTIKDIGSKAALIRGSVGDFYGANIISSGFIPVGTDTVPLDVDDATTGLVTNSTDTMVLGFDRRAAVISQRRGIEMRTEHAFHQDVEEVRFLERVGFKVLRPEWTVLLGDVKNAAVV